MNQTRPISSGALAHGMTVVALLIFGGCKAQEKNPEPVSAVAVETQADGIHLKTGQAEFVLTNTGNLSGRFKNGTQWLTLDDAASSSGVAVTSGKQVVTDFVRDLAHAQIQPANG